MRLILISAVYLFVLGAGLSVIGAGHNAASADDALDGKSFSVKVSEHNKDGEPADDELIFEDGTFFSADCEQYGFTPASYETKSKGNATLFKSTLTSEMGCLFGNLSTNIGINPQLYRVLNIGLSPTRAPGYFLNLFYFAGDMHGLAF